MKEYLVRITELLNQIAAYDVPPHLVSDLVIEIKGFMREANPNRREPNTRHKLKTLEAGESIFVHAQDIESVRQAIYRLRQKHPDREFITRKVSRGDPHSNYTLRRIA